MYNVPGMLGSPKPAEDKDKKVRGLKEKAEKSDRTPISPGDHGREYAQDVTFLQALREADVRVYTFGAPRVGNSDFANVSVMFDLGSYCGIDSVSLCLISLDVLSV